MPRRRKTPLYRKRYRISILPHEVGEIRVNSSAIDYYKSIYKNRSAIDLVVAMYDEITKEVNKCREILERSKDCHDYRSSVFKVKLPNLNRAFEINVLAEIDSKDKIKATVFINIKCSNIIFKMSQIENELTERFLRG